MALSFADFWKLAADSRLLTPQQCQQLHQDFAQVKGAVETGSSKTLAEWLVSRNVLSRYQATILLAGRPGPFVYGDYRVFDRLDAGRFSGFFRAIHGPTGHPVLLQFLTGAVTSDPQHWAAAAHEAAAHCAVASPQLQRWHEIVDLTTFKFVVSEDLHGVTAEERAATRVPPQEACRWVVAAALGLAQLHQAGRVHGDVRPGNIWLESVPNHPGHAKLLRDPLFVPQPMPIGKTDPSGRMAVAADFLAPEFLQPGKLPDPLTDLYALGCTFYTLLAGNPPFAGGTVEQKLARHAAEPIRPLEQFGIPQPIAQLVAYLMAKKPTVRYQQASVVAEQLAAFVDPQLLYASPPSPLPTLPAYEAWIKQKQTVLAAKGATKPAAAAMPGVNVAPAGVAVGGRTMSDRNALTGAATTTAPATGALVTPSGKAPAKIKTKELTPEAREKEKLKQFGLILGGVGVLAIIALIAINMSGGRKPKDLANNEPVENIPAIGVNDNDLAKKKGTGASDLTDRSTNGTKSPVPPDVTPSTTTNNNTTGNKTTNPPTTPVAVTPNKEPGKGTSPVATSGTNEQSLVPDDGKLLWASPTTGGPVDLRAVPDEGQIFIALRPADMLAAPEGERVFASLGPEVAAARAKWETAAGMKFAEAERLIVSFHNNDGKFPRVSVVVYPKGGVKVDEMLPKWGNPAAQKEGNATYYVGGGWAYYVPNYSDGMPLFVMSDPDTIKRTTESQGAPPLVRKELEKLRRVSDVQRHVNVLFSPNFFGTDDGEALFAGGRERALPPLKWLLGDDLQAGLAGLHFGNETYVEVRLLSHLGKDKFTLASEFKERLQKIPDNILTYFTEMNPPPYWRKLAFKFPSMISHLHAQTRVGVEEDAAVVNSLLPGPAAHNLVLGAELAIATAPGGGGTAVAAKPNGNGKSNIKSIDDVLALKTSFSFDAQSLEFAMRDLGNEANDLAKGSPVTFAIKILGDDLKLDGITRNMTIRDFKKDGNTVADILTALVMKANPITTVKDPSEADQKLLWVVGADPDSPDKTIVLITTRQMAEKRNLKLPPPFTLKKT